MVRTNPLYAKVAMQRPKAAVFDLDGTIFDNFQRFKDARRAGLIDNNGKPVQKGRQSMGAAWKKRNKFLYSKKNLAKDTVIPGSKELISSLTNDGYIIIYLTARPKEYYTEILGQLESNGFPLFRDNAERVMLITRPAGNRKAAAYKGDEVRKLRGEFDVRMVFDDDLDALSEISKYDVPGLYSSVSDHIKVNPRVRRNGGHIIKPEAHDFRDGQFVTGTDNVDVAYDTMREPDGDQNNRDSTVGESAHLEEEEEPTLDDYGLTNPNHIVTQEMLDKLRFRCENGHGPFKLNEKIPLEPSDPMYTGYGSRGCPTCGTSRGDYSVVKKLGGNRERTKLGGKRERTKLGGNRERVITPESVAANLEEFGSSNPNEAPTQGYYHVTQQVSKIRRLGFGYKEHLTSPKNVPGVHAWTNIEDAFGKANRDARKTTRSRDGTILKKDVGIVVIPFEVAAKYKVHKTPMYDSAVIIEIPKGKKMGPEGLQFVEITAPKSVQNPLDGFVKTNPVKRGKDSKGPFYKWGKGKKYHYKAGNEKSREAARKKAYEQAKAAFAGGYRKNPREVKTNPGVLPNFLGFGKKKKQEASKEHFDKVVAPIIDQMLNRPQEILDIFKSENIPVNEDDIEMYRYLAEVFKASNMTLALVSNKEVAKKMPPKYRPKAKGITIYTTSKSNLSPESQKTMAWAVRTFKDVKVINTDGNPKEDGDIDKWMETIYKPMKELRGEFGVFPKVVVDGYSIGTLSQLRAYALGIDSERHKKKPNKKKLEKYKKAKKSMSEDAAKVVSIYKVPPPGGPIVLSENPGVKTNPAHPSKVEKGKKLYKHMNGQEPEKVNVEKIDIGDVWYKVGEGGCWQIGYMSGKETGQESQKYIHTFNEETQDGNFPELYATMPEKGKPMLIIKGGTWKIRTDDQGVAWIYD